uniref:Protein TIC 214 n=1 Tax=Mitrastemon kanehirai TaxID=1358725 RepID=A0A4Y1MD74_9ERIC|nr:hypothetical chloroplast RF19 [Mitrastemon kanehirai]
MLITLSKKIINSIFVIGLYFGLITTISVEPAYIFILQAQVEEKKAHEKRIAAITGFILGQLIILFSIYYTPLYLIFYQPHTITIMVLPYWLFIFFKKNPKKEKSFKGFLLKKSNNKLINNTNYFRDFTIIFTFINNFIFQILNNFILPSSVFFRLLNIYMFRFKNNDKFLFLTSTFLAWLIIYIFILKYTEIALNFIFKKKNISNINKISSKFILNLFKYFFFKIRNFFFKYLVKVGLIKLNPILFNRLKKLKWKNLTHKYFIINLKMSVTQIFNIILFILCLFNLGRMPFPILTRKFILTIPKKEKKIENIYNLNSEKISLTLDESILEFIKNYLKKKINLNNDREEYLRKLFNEKKSIFFYKIPNPSLSIYLLNRIRPYWFEKPLVILLFNYNRWNQPLRYINILDDEINKQTNAIKKEVSQYFFNTCQSYGKKRISFTFPPSLKKFNQIIVKVFDFKIDFTQDDTEWILKNNNKFEIFKAKIKIKIEKLDESLLLLKLNKFPQNLKLLETILIIILEKKKQLCKNKRKKKYLPIIYDPLFSLFCGSHRRIITDVYPVSKELYYYSNNIYKKKFNKFNKIYKKLYQEQETFNLKIIMQKILMLIINFPAIELTEKIKIEKVKKKIPLWPYKLIEDIDMNLIEKDEREARHLFLRQLRTRKLKSVIGFTGKSDIDNENTSNSSENSEQTTIITPRYFEKSDFRRGLIKGSIRVKRRKTVTFKNIQINVHSPIFLDRIRKWPLFRFFDIIYNYFKKYINFFVNIKSLKKKNNIYKKKLHYEKFKKLYKEKSRLKIAEAWNGIIFGQIVRGVMLITQLFLRKYIKLYFFIIIKNIIRIFFFESTEWYEDLKRLKKEIYIKCTYEGIPLSEEENSQNLLIKGFQIKILSPFQLKIGQKKKFQYVFLTVWGGEAKHPFGPNRKRQSTFKSIFQPIFKKLKSKKDKYIYNIYIFFYLKKNYFNYIINKLLNTYLNTYLHKNYKDIININIIISFKNCIYILRNIIYLKINILSKKIYIFFYLNIINCKVNLHKYKYIKNIKKLIYNIYINIYIIYFKSIYLNLLNIFNNIYVIIYNISKVKVSKNKNVIIIKQKRRRIDDVTDDVIKDISKIKNINFKLRTYKIKKKKKKYKFYFDKFIKFIFDFKLKNKIFFFYQNIKLYIKFNIKTLKKKTRFIRNFKLIKKLIIKNIFIFIIKACKIYIKISKVNNKNKYKPCNFDLSYVTQAYVFYKLAQTEINNISKNELRFILKYKGTSFYIKNSIKKKLKFYYQYNLYQIKKLKSKFNKYSLLKLNLLKKQIKIKKSYRYNFLCYKYINFENYKNNNLLKKQINSNYDYNILSDLILKKKIYELKPYFIPNMKFFYEKEIKINVKTEDTEKESKLSNSFNQYKLKIYEKIFKNLKIYSLIFQSRQNTKKIILSSILRDEFNLNIIGSGENVLKIELIERGIVNIDNFSKYLQESGYSIMYQTVKISLYLKKKSKNYFFSLIIENILLYNRRREFRILSCFTFTLKKKNNNFNNYINYNYNNDYDKKEALLRSFLWPNYRLEDLACINRYWFNTSKGIHLSMLNVCMYMCI